MKIHTVEEKSKQELITELRTAYQRIAELEAQTVTPKLTETDLHKQHQQMEEALRDSEDKFHILAEAAPVAITIGLTLKRFYYVNSSVQRITGYSKAELLSMGPLDLVHPDFRRMIINWEQHRERLMHTFSRYEIKFIKKDGEERWADISLGNIKIEEKTGTISTFFDITDRKQVAEAFRRRNLELALINRTSRELVSTLDLDQVINNALEEIRRLLEVTACSAWLLDPPPQAPFAEERSPELEGKPQTLICKQTTDIENKTVRGWRMSLGMGVVGWVAQHEESLIVPDTRQDKRHYRNVDQQTGVELRSILAVPLQIKQEIIGVIEAVDTKVNCFVPANLELLESLAATTAIAIENAQLYRQAKQDAQTKKLLLDEVNHRVTNNLMTIISLLEFEQNYVEMGKQHYLEAMENLKQRVYSLSTVHKMLSAAEWHPLPLSKLSKEILNFLLYTLPPDRFLTVEVSPSPVEVNAKQAHNLALVINELATNAIKYAWSEMQDIWQITIRIALENNIICFEFRDNGRGYPEAILNLDQRQFSIGFNLIQNVVCQNLGGSLVVHNDNGAVAVIKFKPEAIDFIS